MVVTTTGGANPTSVTQYLHRDHLGTFLALPIHALPRHDGRGRTIGARDTITNAAGQVVQRMSFDSWGKRREVSWLTMTDGAIAAFDTTATTTRGFTGHEMIDPVGLVHMNGRVYDPEIGRFLSADPFVQETGNLQSWNRYSYVLNNPLSFTDPSGFFFSKLFKSIGKALGSAFRAIGAAVKKILQNPIFRAIINIVGCALPGVGQLACAAITGALTAAAGGSLADSLKAAAFAFVSMGAFKFVGGFTNALSGVGGAILKAGIHGVVGGALSVAQGGSFLQGFAGSAAGALGGYVAGESGFVGSYGDGDAGNSLGRALISGAAGCAGAVISGGKCAEAAVTAAFASLYNGDRGRLVGSIGGGYGGAAAGGGLATLCGIVTGGACAVAGPYLVTGGAWAGRALGGAAGSWAEDWLMSVPDGDRPTLTHNQKHHQNSNSPEPPDVEELYNSAIRDKKGVQWSMDKDGTLHRFSGPRNGQTHWNGSTAGNNPIALNHIPPAIKKIFGIKG